MAIMAIFGAGAGVLQELGDNASNDITTSRLLDITGATGTISAGNFLLSPPQPS
jgi:hypothetical protein